MTLFLVDYGSRGNAYHGERGTSGKHRQNDQHHIVAGGIGALRCIGHPSSAPIGVMKTANAYVSTPYDTTAVTPRVPTIAHP
jgi:hypothetical protein